MTTTTTTTTTSTTPGPGGRRATSREKSLLYNLLVLTPLEQCHYPGIQDLAAVCLLNLESPSLTRLLLERLSSHHLNQWWLYQPQGKHSDKRNNKKINPNSKQQDDDDTVEDEHPVVAAVAALLSRVDLELYQLLEPYLNATQTVLLRWSCTWFTQDLLDATLVSRLLDLFLVGHPAMPLYVSVAFLIVHKPIFTATLVTSMAPSTESEIDKKKKDDNTATVLAILHGMMQCLSTSLPRAQAQHRLEKVVRHATMFMRQISPSDLVGPSINSTNDKDKTTTTSVVLSEMALLHNGTPSWMALSQAPTDAQLLKAVEYWRLEQERMEQEKARLNACYDKAALTTANVVASTPLTLRTGPPHQLLLLGVKEQEEATAKTQTQGRTKNETSKMDRNVIVMTKDEKEVESRPQAPKRSPKKNEQPVRRAPIVMVNDLPGKKRQKPKSPWRQFLLSIAWLASLSILSWFALWVVVDKDQVKQDLAAFIVEWRTHVETMELDDWFASAATRRKRSLSRSSQANTPDHESKQEQGPQVDHGKVSDLDDSDNDVKKVVSEEDTGTGSGDPHSNKGAEEAEIGSREQVGSHITDVQGGLSDLNKLEIDNEDTTHKFVEGELSSDPVDSHQTRGGNIETETYHEEDDGVVDGQGKSEESELEGVQETKPRSVDSNHLSETKLETELNPSEPAILTDPLELSGSQSTYESSSMQANIREQISPESTGNRDQNEAETLDPSSWTYPDEQQVVSPSHQPIPVGVPPVSMPRRRQVLQKPTSPAATPLELQSSSPRRIIHSRVNLPSVPIPDHDRTAVEEDRDTLRDDSSTDSADVGDQTQAKTVDLSSWTYPDTQQAVSPTHQPTPEGDIPVSTRRRQQVIKASPSPAPAPLELHPSSSRRIIHSRVELPSVPIPDDDATEAEEESDDFTEHLNLESTDDIWHADADSVDLSSWTYPDEQQVVSPSYQPIPVGVPPVSMPRRRQVIKKPTSPAATPLELQSSSSRRIIHSRVELPSVPIPDDDATEAEEESDDLDDRVNLESTDDIGQAEPEPVDLSSWAYPDAQQAVSPTHLPTPEGVPSVSTPRRREVVKTSASPAPAPMELHRSSSRRIIHSRVKLPSVPIPDDDATEAEEDSDDLDDRVNLESTDDIGQAEPEPVDLSSWAYPDAQQAVSPTHLPTPEGVPSVSTPRRREVIKTSASPAPAPMELHRSSSRRIIHSRVNLPSVPIPDDDATEAEEDSDDFDEHVNLESTDDIGQAEPEPVDLSSWAYPDAQQAVSPTHLPTPEGVPSVSTPRRREVIKTSASPAPAPMELHRSSSRRIIHSRVNLPSVPIPDDDATEAEEDSDDFDEHVNLESTDDIRQAEPEPVDLSSATSLDEKQDSSSNDQNFAAKAVPQPTARKLKPPSSRRIIYARELIPNVPMAVDSKSSNPQDNGDDESTEGAEASDRSESPHQHEVIVHAQEQEPIVPFSVDSKSSDTRDTGDDRSKVHPDPEVSNSSELYNQMEEIPLETELVAGQPEEETKGMDATTHETRIDFYNLTNLPKVCPSKLERYSGGPLEMKVNDLPVLHVNRSVASDELARRWQTLGNLLDDNLSRVIERRKSNRFPALSNSTRDTWMSNNVSQAEEEPVISPSQSVVSHNVMSVSKWENPGDRQTVGLVSDSAKDSLAMREASRFHNTSLSTCPLRSTDVPSFEYTSMEEEVVLGSMGPLVRGIDGGLYLNLSTPVEDIAQRWRDLGVQWGSGVDDRTENKNVDDDDRGNNNDNNKHQDDKTRNRPKPLKWMRRRVGRLFQRGDRLEG